MAGLKKLACAPRYGRNEKPTPTETRVPGLARDDVSHRLDYEPPTPPLILQNAGYLKCDLK